MKRMKTRIGCGPKKKMDHSMFFCYYEWTFFWQDMSGLSGTHHPPAGPTKSMAEPPWAHEWAPVTIASCSRNLKSQEQG